MTTRTWAQVALFIGLISLLPIGHSQKIFRDTTFGDSCVVAEGNLLAFDDVKSVDSCEEFEGNWFTVEVARLFESDGVTFNYNFDRSGDNMWRVVMRASGVTMKYLSNVRSTFNQVYGTARFDITSRYNLKTLQEPDASTGVANRQVAEWVRDDGVTIMIYAGVPPIRPEVGVEVSVIYDRPNPDAGQF